MTKLNEYNQFKQHNIAVKCFTHKVSFCFCVLLFLYLSCFTGCASRKEIQGTQQKEAVKEIPASESELSLAMHAAEDVLGSMHFEIDKADMQKGYIRTRPLAGAQFFEFWRSDNVGFKKQLLSNLHSIRRIVELEIKSQDDELDIDCKVHVQRLSMPQHEIASNAQAYQMFTASSVSLQRLEPNPEQKTGMTWIEINNDKKLEGEILKRISSLISKENDEKRTEGES